MIIKKGILNLRGATNFIHSQNLTIYEKTEGNYTEVLVQHTDSLLLDESDTVVSESHPQNDFTVYVGMTIPEIASKYAVAGNDVQSWVEPLMEV